MFIVINWLFCTYCALVNFQLQEKLTEANEAFEKSKKGKDEQLFNIRFYL